MTPIRIQRRTASCYERSALRSSRPLRWAAPHSPRPGFGPRLRRIWRLARRRLWSPRFRLRIRLRTRLVLLASVFVLPAAVRSVDITPRGADGGTSTGRRPPGRARIAAPCELHRGSGRSGRSRATSELPAEIALDRFALPCAAHERNCIESLQAVRQNAEPPAERDPADPEVAGVTGAFEPACRALRCRRKI